MKITSHLIILSIALSFVACSETDKNKAGDTEKSENMLPVVSPTAVDNQGQVSGSSELNPAHGEPGHRCEIAVGAPMDSEPTQPNISTEIQPNLSTAPTLTPTTGNETVAEGTNPAHGQPGHDCAVAVGAPLKK